MALSRTSFAWMCLARSISIEGSLPLEEVAEGIEVGVVMGKDVLVCLILTPISSIKHWVTFHLGLYVPLYGLFWYQLF